MFTRVEVRAGDLAASRDFYATVLDALGLAATERDAWADFVLAQADASHPPTRGLHIGFAAPSHAAVDAFWEAGIGAGHRDDGRPGPRPQYVADYYGAFLLDPDGNSAEAVHYDDMRSDGTVDHLWIGVADLAASQHWYEVLAQRTGLGTGEREQRFNVCRPDPPGGSFALVADGRAPTHGLRMAIATGNPAAAGVQLDPDGTEVELVERPRP